VSETPAVAFAPERLPGFGEPAPFFRAPTDTNPAFAFESLGGTWIVLMFFGSLGVPAARQAHDTILARRALFNDLDAMFFGVSIDPQDRSARGLANSMPGLRYFWDFDRKLSELYGVQQGVAFAPMVFLLDRSLRVAASAPLGQLGRVLDHLAAVVEAERPRVNDMLAPVLTVPRIFEPEFCQRLIDYYESVGGTPSGVMREANGMTVPVLDDKMKRRRDLYLDETLAEEARIKIVRRLVPMVERAYGWKATRIERYLIACYDGAEGGLFRAHRDNTTAGTAHRKFAVTINLNADYDGGELRFPEFGPRLYKPPTGGATVFGCSLLHEAKPVTRGVRYAFVPFLYDAEGARIREANRRFLADAAAAKAEEAVTET
jgi:peroxiredoxin/predicted 2-oxoglutarate/Fe(II)-dependent dioxygenase YbiX